MSILLSQCICSLLGLQLLLFGGEFVGHPLLVIRRVLCKGIFLSKAYQSWISNEADQNILQCLIMPLNWWSWPSANSLGFCILVSCTQHHQTCHTLQMDEVAYSECFYRFLDKIEPSQTSFFLNHFWSLVDLSFSHLNLWKSQDLCKWLEPDKQLSWQCFINCFNKK